MAPDSGAGLGGAVLLDSVLSDIVVLDFGQLIAGPVCGMWLADMGATVIKMEPPGGELARALGPPWLNGESLTALTSNRNKLGLCIDLKHPLARGVVARLVQKADVLVENFRPGVTRRLGLDYDALRGVNPRLVYCSISAYGENSPWSGRPGVDGTIQAASGLMSGIGTAESDPGKAPMPLADMAGALFAALGVLGALRRRDREGIGSHLDISLYNAMLMLQQMNVAAFLSSGILPEKSGSAAPYAAPNEALPTSDGWIMVAAYQPKRWESLCAVLGRPDLAGDERFATNASRVANRPALRDALSSILRTHDTAHWCRVLTEADIIAAPVVDYAGLVSSEQYEASGIEVTVDQPTAGRFRMPGFAVGSSAMPPRHPAPRAGEHGRQVLARFGYDKDETDELIAQGVVTGEAA